MVDGDSYLIKLVKKRPVIWNKSCFDNRDSKSRNVAWKEIASQIGAECDWIRRRWYGLRERFVKELKSSYKTKAGVAKTKGKSRFKHFNDLMFLVKYVEFRKKTKIPFGSTEFVITKEEIEEENGDEMEYIFLELAEDNSKKEEDCLIGEYLDDADELTTPNAAELTYNDNIESTPNKIKIKHFEKSEDEKECTSSSQVISTSENVSSNDNQTNKHEQITPERNEDIIFGELVTAMLLGMEAYKKKFVKKELMNILLS